LELLEVNRKQGADACVVMRNACHKRIKVLADGTRVEPTEDPASSRVLKGKLTAA
jgi:hypothetical protein